MSISTYLDSLADKHAELEKELHHAYIHHNEDRVNLIKRQKLLIKDKISSALKQAEKQNIA